LGFEIREMFKLAVAVWVGLQPAGRKSGPRETNDGGDKIEAGLERSERMPRLSVR